MEWLVIVLYSISLTIIFLFSLGQLDLALAYLKNFGNFTENEVSQDEQVPFVTVQLPVYNEKYVVARLIESVSQFDYPKDRFEIQVLDDSNDETTAIIADKIEELKKANEYLQIHLVRRPERVGFKAGALAYGLKLAQGDYIAIFDADFLPQPDFLRKTVGYFSNQSVGVVQTRWGHINKEYSLLTKMQAFGLDGHFTVEQKGRNNAGSFMSFNGTAGIWRKNCINDAGGWHYDTLTEDLDLSYRAQMKGWKFVYLEDVVAPAELPIIMPAVKSQQYRWNKGAAETAKKNLFQILFAPMSFRKKVHALFHLLGSSVFIMLLIAGLLSIPMLYIKEHNPQLDLLFNALSVFLIGFFAISFFYWLSSRKIEPDETIAYYFKNYFLYLSFSMGMAFHNGMAVIEGFLGIKTPFIRTPKFNVNDKKDSWTNNTYVMPKLGLGAYIEAILCLYFIFGIIYGIYIEDYGLLLFHLMMAVGFGGVFFYSVKPFYAKAKN